MKNTNLKIKLAIACSVLLGTLSCSQPQQQTETVKNEYLVAAYIWPSCHDDSLGRAKLWSEGTGEWEVIKKGNPRFRRALPAPTASLGL
jgi:hypothetical protein